MATASTAVSHDQSTVEDASSFSYYQVLSDMRVMKIHFDPEETMRLLYTMPIWRWSIIGEYVYFPSEEKWIFVNQGIDDEDWTEKDQSRYQLPSTSNYQYHSYKKNNTINIPKIRYCAHRSHTPTANFQEVVHREPIRENWPFLFSKLMALKHDIDWNNDRRFRRRDFAQCQG